MRLDLWAHALGCAAVTVWLGWPWALGAAVAKELWDLAAKRWPRLRFTPFGWPLVAGTGWDWTDILADVWGVVVGLALKLI